MYYVGAVPNFDFPAMFRGRSSRSRSGARGANDNAEIRRVKNSTFILNKFEMLVTANGNA